LLPENIVQETADGSKVIYTIGSIGNENTAKVTQKKIELGYTSGAFVEVKSGLASGETVVTDGAKSLKDGITVEVIK
ncbi:MAG: efflux RND transporter periplasmic adaptor subunit, partial [Flavobacteriales bacterium]|nr:efflux RND transporter periplasmic adaptor subunit [Flavobacteriales bacterium]